MLRDSTTRGITAGEAIKAEENLLARWDEALAIYRRDRNLNKLAIRLRDHGDLAGARRLFERALVDDKVVLGGPDHLYSAVILDSLAILLQVEGYPTGARALFEHALSIREKSLGPDHPDMAESLNSLATLLLLDQHDLAGARQLFERALAIRENALGPDHPDTAESLTNLATVFQGLGAFPRARRLSERALAIRENALGPDHPDMAESLEQLGIMQLQTLHDPAGARRLLERTLTIREIALGPDHPDTAGSLYHLAIAFQTLGETPDARRLFKRALVIQEKALGFDHPHTVASRASLARLPQVQEKDELISGEARYTVETPSPEAAAALPQLRMEETETIDAFAARKGMTVAQLEKAVDNWIAANSEVTARETTGHAKEEPYTDDLASRLEHLETEASKSGDGTLVSLIARYKMGRNVVLPPDDASITDPEQAKDAARLPAVFKSLQARLTQHGLDPLPPDPQVLKAQRQSVAFYRKRKPAAHKTL
jgi:tetratricopeptide (TPR) repeat protein